MQFLNNYSFWIGLATGCRLLLDSERNAFNFIGLHQIVIVLETLSVLGLSGMFWLILSI